MIAPHVSLQSDVSYAHNHMQCGACKLCGATTCNLHVSYVVHISCVVQSNVSYVVQSDVSYVVQSDVSYVVQSNVSCVVQSDVSCVVQSDVSYVVHLLM